MVAIISLLLVLTLSILVTRIASIALTHTGLSKESARFQARSAFTGVGFTTSEAEKVVNHPVRRRILLLLMLLGNAGIITAVSSLILTFVSPTASGSLNLKLFLLISGIVVLWVAAQSQWIDSRLSKVVNWALKRYSKLDVRDYAGLLQVVGDYQVSELKVEEQDWLANKKLVQLKLRDEGVLVLGIYRANKTYIGAPRGETEVLPDDTLILYGRTAALESLDERKKGIWGDKEHKEAVEDQQKVAEVEHKEEEKVTQEVRQKAAKKDEKHE